MDYIFGTKLSHETLKTVSETDEILEGWQNVVREYDDCDITDSFYIAEHTDSKVGADGLYYNWYTITSHTRQIDRWKLIRANEDAADMAYVNSELALAILNETEG